MNNILDMMETELSTARLRVAAKVKTAASFGHYGDCGDDYNDDYRDAKAVVEYLEDLLPKLRRNA